MNVDDDDLGGRHVKRSGSSLMDRTLLAGSSKKYSEFKRGYSEVETSEADRSTFCLENDLRVQASRETGDDSAPVEDEPSPPAPN